MNRLSKVSPEAQTIKYADIIDNAKEIGHSNPDFAMRYVDECYDIVTTLKDGNSDLRLEALEVVRMQKKSILNNLQ